jgi:hypothetical protein
MEVVSIVIRYASHSLDPVVKDVFRHRPLNLVQKHINAVKKIRWPGEQLACQCTLDATENAELRWC